jgi:hypothetical protein
MRTPVTLEEGGTLPPGHWLMRTNEPRLWSLWHSVEDADLRLVSVEGTVSRVEGGLSFPKEWDEAGIFYPVLPENVAAYVMAARHMNQDQWTRFCERQTKDVRVPDALPIEGEGPCAARSSS